MGTMITLGIGRFDIDWGKNKDFTNHSALFLPSDVKYIKHHDFAEEVKVLSRSLGTIRSRLNLLGFSLSQCEKFYLQAAQSCWEEGIPPLSFEKFQQIIFRANLREVSQNVDFYNNDRLVNHSDLSRSCLKAFPDILMSIPGEEEGLYNFDYFIEGIHPYIVLRILAEKPENAEIELEWLYSEVVESGWVREDEIVKPLLSEQRVLVVTEGSSDSAILKKAFSELRPEIADFFHFVDMAENYPFTGTGNLFRFCEGLTSISIQNKVLVLFDNDTAGKESFVKASKLKESPNMLFMLLPEHPDFENVLTVGPGGESRENINGRAVAIENFLDLQLSGKSSPRTRWKGYNSKTESYQGALENKERYSKYFFKSTIGGADYDSRKLEFLLDHIVERWVLHLSAHA